MAQHVDVPLLTPAPLAEPPLPSLPGPRRRRTRSLELPLRRVGATASLVLEGLACYAAVRHVHRTALREGEGPVDQLWGLDAVILLWLGICLTALVVALRTVWRTRAPRRMAAAVLSAGGIWALASAWVIAIIAALT